MAKIITTISSACVTKNYISEHGSVVNTSPDSPVKKDRVPRDSIEFKGLLIRINQMVMNKQICEVELYIELDTFSHQCIKMFDVIYSN